MKASVINGGNLAKPLSLASSWLPLPLEIRTLLPSRYREGTCHVAVHEGLLTVMGKNGEGGGGGPRDPLFLFSQTPSA